MNNEKGFSFFDDESKALIELPIEPDEIYHGDVWFWCKWCQKEQRWLECPDRLIN